MAKKAVISNLDPVPTFLWLVGGEHLSPEVALAVNNYDDEQMVLFTNYYLLNEPLRLKAFDGIQNFDPAIEKEVYAFNFGAESVEDTCRVHYCYARGELPDPPLALGGCLRHTSIDPTQAPDGMHTLLIWTEVPYNLRRWKDQRFDGPRDWDKVRESYADRVEDLLAEYAPNIKTAKVERFVQTPLDFMRRNQSRIMGGVNGGAISNNQWGMNRPFPGCGAPRTPIQQLYITDTNFSRATWLVGGYLAAVAVAEDLGIRDQSWWNAKALQPYLDYCQRTGRNRKVKF